MPPNTGRTQEHFLRTNVNTHPPHSRTNTYRRSFIQTGIREWNNIPHDIRDAPTLESLKTYLSQDKKHVPNYVYLPSTSTHPSL